MPDDQTPLEDLLRRRPWEGVAGGEPCGDAELLAAYAEGRLPSTPRERLERHLAACAACQAAVVRLVRLAPQESVAGPAAAGPQTAPARTFPVFRWRWALPALASVILVGSFIYYERYQIVEPQHPTAPAQVAERAAPPAEAPPGPLASQASPPAAIGGSTATVEAEREPEVAGKLDAGVTEEVKEQELRQQESPGAYAARQAAAADAPAAPPAAQPLEADRAARLESAAEPTLKKEAEPQELDEAAAEQPADFRAKREAANKLADRATAQPAPKPSLPMESQTQPATPETARSKVLREGRRAERDDLAEEKAAAGGPAAAAPGELEKGHAAAESDNRVLLPPSKVSKFGPFVKNIVSGWETFALTYSGLLVTDPAGSHKWKPLDIPATGKVADFDIFEKHLWVLMYGGRVLHSPNLGRSWYPAVETHAEDATTIAFTDALSGEIRTRSGRRLHTTDGGKSWHQAGQ